MTMRKRRTLLPGRYQQAIISNYPSQHPLMSARACGDGTLYRQNISAQPLQFSLRFQSL
jgi:hypothetical protein